MAAFAPPCAVDEYALPRTAVARARVVRRRKAGLVQLQARFLVAASATDSATGAPVASINATTANKLTAVLFILKLLLLRCNVRMAESERWDDWRPCLCCLKNGGRQ